MKLHPWLAAFIILGAGIASGQVATGTPPFGSFGGGPFDTVNLGNLNVHFAIPVLHKAGRGTPFTYDLSYDSSIWTPVTSTGVTQWQPATNWGWRGTTEAQVGYITNSQSTIPNDSCSTTIFSNYVYHDALGAPHPFPGSAQLMVYMFKNLCIGMRFSPLSATASDGSGYTLNVTNAGNLGGQLTDRGGKIIAAPLNTTTGAATLTDANGNQLSVNSSGQFFDTLSSTTPVLTVSGAGTASSPLTFTYPAPADGASSCNPITQCVSYTMGYTQYTVQTAFGVSNASGLITEYGPLSVPLVSSIALPDDTPTHPDRYTFTYESGPSSCSPCVTGRIKEVTLPTGGTITYAYTGGTNNTGIYSDGSTADLNRTLSLGGEWKYVRSLVSGTPGPGSMWTTTVTDPPGNQTLINFAEDSTTTTSTTVATYNLYETQRQVYQGTDSLLATIVRCYNGQDASCYNTAVSSPIYTTDTYYQPANGSTRASHVEYDGSYNASGLVSDDKEYNYGVQLGAAPSSTYLVRETAITYASLTNNIYDKPASVTVYDWTNGKVTLASSTYAYDQTTPTTTSGTPQHVAITGSRGNLTTATTSTSSTASLSKTFTYYDTGNVVTAQDVNGAQTTYTYGACGNSFPTSVAEPLNLSKSSTWNCTGGVQTSVTDENGKTVTVDYSTDPYFWRPDYTLDQLNNKTTFAYYTAPTAMESTLSFNSGISVSDLRVTLDGLGRSMLTQRAQTPSLAEYDSSETDYNNVGLPSRWTMPFQAAKGVTNSSAPGTTAVYDALGRPTTLLDGGGGTVSYQYIQNDVLQKVGPTQTFQKQFEYDGLGRLSSVCEVTAGTATWLGGNCNQTNPLTGYLTQYTYDALGRLLTVTQNAQASSNHQSRAYAYDWLGRLTSETNPETGNGTAGTVNYTYDVACGSYPASSGDLTKRVDNAGNTTCYKYDAFHRMTDAGKSGPTCRHFRYDAQTPPTGIAVSTTLARMAEAYTDNCSSTLLTDEWFGYDADGNLTDFYQSTPHSGGYYHTQAGYWPTGMLGSLSALTASKTAIFPTISYGTTGAGLDGEGRMLKVNAASGTNPVSSVTYSSTTTASALPGSLTAVAFPSGDSDAFTYDPNTGRPAGYQFSVNGNNDQGSLTWNPNGTLAKLVIADQIPNTTDSQTCNYLYDDLGRVGLTPGVQSPPYYAANCGTAWQQNFTYDPFGNIAKSGSSTFLPTYSTATNQFTISGANVNYDANGNLRTDNLNNSYTWDPNWGNPASINSTNLIYDALGQMVEQQNGSTYTQMLYSQLGKTAIMNGQTLSKAFVSLPGSATAIYNSSGTLAYYRHSDWLGSSRLTSTPARGLYSSSAYAPFGEQYAPSGTPDPSFTGQNSDTASSLYDFTFREYSPSQGRWISPDPAGIAAVDPTNPQSWNRYAYVANNPLSFVDPLGLLLMGPGNTCIGDTNGIVCGPGGIDGGGDGSGGGVGSGGVGSFCDASGNCSGICVGGVDAGGNCPGGFVGGNLSPITLPTPPDGSGSIQFGAAAIASQYKQYLSGLVPTATVLGSIIIDPQYLQYLAFLKDSAPTFSANLKIPGVNNPPGNLPNPCNFHPTRSCFPLPSPNPPSLQFLSTGNTATPFWDFFP